MNLLYVNLKYNYNNLYENSDTYDGKDTHVLLFIIEQGGVSVNVIINRQYVSIMYHYNLFHNLDWKLIHK